MANDHTLKAIIIDDEENARENLKMMVEEFCEGIKVMGVAPDARIGKELVEAIDPDVVFLDIMMPARDGFGFLNSFEERDFEVIFTTAHNEHALRAYKANAAQYLEKPINIEDLIAAVERVRSIVKGKESSGDDLTELLKKIVGNDENERFPIAHAEGVSFIAVKDVVHLEAQDQYTLVHLSSGKTIVSSKSIKVYEESLSERIFFRAHRSHIINLVHHLKEFTRSDGGCVIMSNDTVVPIARRKLPLFLDRVKIG